jgi:hypothetical protein
MKGPPLIRLLDYLRGHALALTALACSVLALAGASYAAVALPAGSVGTAQLRNGSITPPKFNRSIAGYVRAWAHVSASGHIIAGSPGAIANYNGLSGTTVPGPNYFVGWKKAKLSTHCAAVVTLDSNGPVTSRGSTAEAAIVPGRQSFFPGKTHTAGAVSIIMASSADQNIADNFYVAVLC